VTYMKKLIREICPPLFVKVSNRLRSKVVRKYISWKSHRGHRCVGSGSADDGHQDLDLYWDAKFAEVLETWGEGHVWNEIALLMAGHEGRVLDVACGTGKTMELLRKFSQLDLYGCDISDMLIDRARERGIEDHRLGVSDATKMTYENDSFNYAYSIGSLEHFTEDGIAKCIGECFRVSRIGSFHMIPTSKSERDEGWITIDQSWHNNSVGWWLAKFKSIYQTVHVLDSGWQGGDSFVGKWFVCFNK